MSSPAIAQEKRALEHTEPTYPERKVCELFGGVHKKTLRRWTREGIALPDGSRIYPRCIPIGRGKYVYEVREVERIWRALKLAGANLAEGEEEEELGELVEFPCPRSGCSLAPPRRDRSVV